MRDVAALLIGGARLLTLTGPGGSGKTRLAIESAAGLIPHFEGGVFWVGLAALRDPGLVCETVARVLGAKESLADHIGEREVLVLLDNFEQVVEAAPELSGLVEVCPNLRVLVTSRELLRVHGEVEYPVLPLAEAEAVELFCVRARADPEADIAELCRRLDMLPLAVELAAARTSVLSPAQILGRISERLDLLKGGRDAEPRQQTLRATIEWSCQLLNQAETQLFARLAVFEGGCSLDGAEEVTGANVDVLQSLVDKSLLRHSGERFWMLETIREYALERLGSSGEEDALRRRHLAWCVALLERSEPALAGPGHNEVGRRMEAEFGNVRSAFARSLDTADTEASLRIVGLRRFWQSVQGHMADGLAWGAAALGNAEGADPALRARAMMVAGDLRRVQGHLDEARSYLEQALSIQRELPDQGAVGQTAFVLGRVESAAGRAERADDLTDESVSIARAVSDRQALGERLAQLGEIAYDRGAAERARALLEEALGLARTTGDAHTEAESLRLLGVIERDAGQLETARHLLDQAVTLQRELSDWNCVSLSLSVLGDVALRAEEPARASTLFAESLELQRGLGQWSRLLDVLWGLGAASAAQGRLRRAAIFLGAEEGLRSEAGTPFRFGDGDRHAAVLQMLRQRMDESALSAAWREGLAMGPDEALACALADHQSETDRGPEPAAASSVFRREGEYWTIAFEGKAFRLRDAKGLHYLVYLLQHPGREFHVLDLVAIQRGAQAVPTRLRSTRQDDLYEGGISDAGPILDEQAKSSYRARFRDLEEDLNEATAWADSVRAEKVRQEMDILADQLSAAVGLSGRDRKAGSPAERARVNITRAVKAVLSRIREHHPRLAEHLDATIHTGTFCSYSPDPRAPSIWHI